MLDRNIILTSIVRNPYDRFVSCYINANIKLKNICVFNIVPPVQKDTVLEDPDYPFLGTDEERKKYVLYFNKKLKEECIKKNYIFFDIYDNYCDENGYLIKDLSDGRVHIRNGVYIKNFIYKFLL